MVLLPSESAINGRGTAILDEVITPATEWEVVLADFVAAPFLLPFSIKVWSNDVLQIFRDSVKV